MAEADRILREHSLKYAMKQQMDPVQAVPMAGYDNVKPPGYSPSQYYQTLLSTGLPKQDAQKQVYQMMQGANTIAQDKGGEQIWPMEGEF